MNYRIPLMYAKRTARRLYSALVCPQFCLLCGSLSVQGLPVCQPCIERFFLPYIADFHSDRQSNHPRCRRCGKILVSEHDLCTRCRAIAETGAPEQKNAHTRIFSLFPYIGLGQKLVPVWKNNNVRTFSAVFAPLIRQFLMQNSALAGIPVVPVPPRPQKLREKGWDQVEDLVRELSVYPQMKICRCLKRQDGTPQKKLSKTERAVNLLGKIRVSAKNIPEKLILLDDVMTTGATIETCARILRQAGCKKVYAICLFFD